MYRLRLVRKSMSGTQSGRKAEAAPCICGKKHKDSDSATKFFGRYLHPYSGTDHSEERRGFRCPFRRELGCRTRLYRNARRTRGHAGQQVCAKPYRPHYQQAKEFLESGRPVLFSGTPCQIRGLKLFLAKEYENLLTVDLVCHGVPSPEIWRQYLHETIARKGFKHTNSELRSTSQITGINFRDKTTGWQHFSLRFILRRETGAGLPETADVSRIHYKDPFFFCFLSHVTERYSCYACPAKELKSGSDITLGDFWGFRGTKDFPDDNNGISLLLINTDQGSKYITGTLRSEQSYEKVIKQNPMITASLIKDPRRDTFYKAVAKSSLHRQSKKLRLINKIKRYANRLADLALGNRIR